MSFEVHLHWTIIDWSCVFGRRRLEGDWSRSLHQRNHLLGGAIDFVVAKRFMSYGIDIPHHLLYEYIYKVNTNPEYVHIPLFSSWSSSVLRFHRAEDHHEL